MKPTRREPLASSEPLPDLAEFLAPFDGQFVRSEARRALERYLTGLLTEAPIKNCDTLAQVIPRTSEQRLQGLLTPLSHGRCQDRWTARTLCKAQRARAVAATLCARRNCAPRTA